MKGIPQTWSTMSFEEGIETISDLGLRVEQREYLAEGLLPVIDQGINFIGGYTNDLSKRYRGPLPVIAFGDHTRRIKYVDFDFAVGAQGVKLLKARDCWVPKYLAYLLSVLPIPDRGYGRHYQFLRKLVLPLPPLNEQVRILGEAEKHLSLIDVGQRSLTKALANLNRYRASILKAACEGRLVTTEAELARAQGQATVLKAACEGRLIHLEDKQVNSQGLQEGWFWSTLEKITSPDRRCAYGVLQPGPHIDGGVPLIRVGDIADGTVLHKDMKRISPSIASQYPRTKLHGGEVLITLVGAIGRTAVVPTGLSGANVARAVGVIPVAEWVDPHWVEIWLRSPQSQAEIIPKAHEVARKTLNLEDVRATRIAIPPIPEQHRIVAEVSRLTSLINIQASVLQTTLQRANRLIAAILDNAFRGELVAQDPKDEPASVLLERIRQAQKADSNTRPRKRRRDRKPLGT